MRIQLVSFERIGIEDFGPHGGTGISQRMLAKGLAARGHQVQLLLMSDAEWEKALEGYVLRGWKRAGGRLGVFRNLSRQRRLAREFASSSPDCVTVIPDVCAISWPYPLSSKKVIKFTCTHLLQKYEAKFDRPRLKTALAERLMVPRADAFTAISRRTAEVSSHLFRVPLDSIAVIPNAVDTQLFSPKQGMRKSKQLVFAGTITEKKGAMEAVAALDILRRGDPEYHMLMIGRSGTGYDGTRDFVGRIKSRYPETCERAVRFLGFLNNELLPDYFRTAAVVVLPSYYESFGRTTIEAMACGSVVVRSDAPPAEEIIEDGVSGVLCRTRDAEDLAAKISSVVRQERLMEQIGRAARQRAVEEFSIERVTLSTERFLLEVVKGQGCRKK